MFFSSTYSLRKSKRILNQAWTYYRKKKETLPPEQLFPFENSIQTLKSQIENKERANADRTAHQLEDFCESHFPKTWAHSLLEIGSALVFALVIAGIVRSSWFEPYEIPTGSMRPTFREQDHLTVTKTAFGINVPMETAHFYFDPNLVQRTSVIIFSGDNLPVIETDSTFMGIFPYKKRFIKRLIGKPGDTFYFYGGKIWGIDSQGNQIDELIHSKWMDGIEHIPFITFDGVINIPAQNQIVFDQMHKSIARLTLSRAENAQGEINTGRNWIPDNPFAATKPHDSPVTYSDFWGIGNFAMARLLTKDQLQAEGLEIPASASKDAILYLELRHHPSVTYPKPQFYTSGGMTGITLSSLKSVLPVKKEHLDALRQNLYTSRFIVKNGQVMRYSVEESTPSSNSVRLPGVPDGTYEFYHGKASKVGFGGYLSALPENHPLYNPSPDFLQKLFNLGINWDLSVESQSKSPRAFPSRYAYFRDGDMYLLGGKIYPKGDAQLEAFIAAEKDKSTKSTNAKPYLPFLDVGAPLKDGKFDADFIHHFGFTIPDKQYMVLGDNHAMSGDSRVFGFVPEDNLQGAPSLILWPPGERWGTPAQKPYPIFVLPRLIVWSIALVAGALWYYIHRRRTKISLPIRNKN